MSSTVPTVDLKIWRSDAIVLFDWLMSVDLNAVPITHRAEKQALMDLLTRLEEVVPYGFSGDGLTQEEIDGAREEVSRDMGW